MTDAVTWVATVSDGSTVAENSGEYVEVPGERKPWVRLATALAENDQHLTSLRLNYKGRTIHMPRANFGRFALDGSRAPLFYSLDYKVEAEMGDDGAFGNEKRFIALIAHFEDFEVHYIQDLEDGNSAWVAVTEGYNPIAPSPRKRATDA